VPGVHFSGAVEGPTDEAVLRTIVRARGAVVHRVHVQHGKPNLRRALPGYNDAAKRSPWIVVVDLDDECPCASMLVKAWLPVPSPQMRFRVAVRQIEAWLLADADRFSTFFGVRRGQVPDHPDELTDPKDAVIALVAASKKAAIKADMVPRPGSGRRVGPAYAARLIEFVTRGENGWRLDQAASASPSLRRCVERVDELVR
jgi:hypothetical protein